jgi:hypothetical protein
MSRAFMGNLLITLIVGVMSKMRATEFLKKLRLALVLNGGPVENGQVKKRAPRASRYLILG